MKAEKGIDVENDPKPTATTAPESKKIKKKKRKVESIDKFLIKFLLCALPNCIRAAVLIFFSIIISLPF